MNRFYFDYLTFIQLGYLRIFYQFHEQIYSNVSKIHFEKKNSNYLMLKTNRAFSRNLRQHSILARKDTFYEKSLLPPNPTPFLKILHQNIALHDFPKRRQHLIVKRNIGLEYTLTKYDLKDFNKFI